LSGRPDRLSWLTARPFAHRGLHGAGLSENGMAAFEAAIAAGYGIECDVRASRDGVALVFHDAMLARMTGVAGSLGAREAADLDALALPDGGAIPRLAALLERCGGGVPMLIEIKVQGRTVAPLCAAVARDVAVWTDAPVAIMSFNPLVVRWFRQYSPQVVRGLVVTEQGKGMMRGKVGRALALWLGKPDFLACDIRDLPSPFTCRARAKGRPVLTWTVRSDDDHARAARHADQIIFETPHD
jgi:glycerophosphoryl diester phosphodiesterase